MAIGIDIKYGDTKEATLSVRRPRYVREDGEGIDVLEAEETIISHVCYSLRAHEAKANLGKAFRAGDGSFVNSINVLCLNLADFATDEMLTNMHFGNSTEVKISYHSFSIGLRECKSRENQRKGAEPRV